MIVLNNSYFPIINTYNPKSPSIKWTGNNTAGLLQIKNECNQLSEVWYSLFSCENSFKIYNILELISDEVLKKILDKEAFIVVDNALEPFEKSIDSIYKNIVIKANIPASQIILLTNMYDAGSYSRNLAKDLNQSPIRIFWYKVFEQDLKCAIAHIYNEEVPTTLSVKKYNKKFLNFNRRWRLHRPFLTTLLYGRNLIDKGYVSFGPCDEKDTWPHRWPELMHYFRNDLEMTELLNSYSGVKDMPPLFLDTTELHINRADSTVNTNKYYEDTYFSVVSETTFCTKEWYNSARFLSEKAFKPIAMKHPFIVVSVPNSLEIYKIMGYKTFSGIIDESYDLETDDGKRMLMIVNEIERLCNLSEVELENFLNTAKEICEYNYNVLMSKTSFITEL